MAEPDIFLSYNREDANVARRFAEAFAAQGFNVWWDTALRSGEAYDEVTEAALRAAKAVVVLWSPRSVVSRWVRAEATIADRAKTLVPVMIEPCERPIMFELTQTAELAHWTGDAGDRAWLSFLNDVRGFVGKERVALAASPSLAQVAAKAEPSPETLLAVLPFDNLSSDSEMAFFSDGVSDDILGRIMRGSKLRVIGRTSSFQFRGADKPKAAAALGASHVLDGSIRRAGTKVRIAAHLTEAASQTLLWSDKYDRDLEDIFAVQDEISKAIADALDAAFFPVKAAKIDPAIYDLYLRAKPLAADPAAWAKSITLLEAVTAAAPDFADGWGRLAFFRAHARIMMPFGLRAGITEVARADIARALALNPSQADAKFAATALIDPWGDFISLDLANRELMRCAGNHAHALSFTANSLYYSGHVRDAVHQAQLARDLDPQEPMCNWMLGVTHFTAGQLAQACEVLAEGMELAPDNHYISGTLIWANAAADNWAEVDRLLDPARLVQFPLRDMAPRVLPIVGFLKSRSPDAARELMSALRQKVEDRTYVRIVDCATVASIGFLDEVYALVDSAILGPTGGSGDDLGLGSYYPSLFGAAHTAFRADPRFIRLCARLGLVEYWLATQKWPDCADETPYDFRAECERHRDFPKDVFFAG